MTAYLAEHPEIHDVIVSGGDPLTMATESLERVLAALRAVPTVEIIRIGTRMPVVMPMRITDELTAMLRKYHPIWINTHFNHPPRADAGSPRRLRPPGRRRHPARQPDGAAARRQRLPRDHRATCAAGLVRSRVRPYYLFQCDLVRGVEHFRTPLARGHRDHGVPSRKAKRVGDPDLRGRRTARRRKDPGASELRRFHQPDAHGAEEFRGPAGNLPRAKCLQRGLTRPVAPVGIIGLGSLPAARRPRFSRRPRPAKSEG